MRTNPATPDSFPPANGPQMRMTARAMASPSFQRWFRGSVVRWPDGTPRVMYHGTMRGGIDRFRSHRGGGDVIAGFFAFDPGFAANYASNALEEDEASIYPVVLSLPRVFDVRDESDQREVGVLFPFAQWAAILSRSGRDRSDITEHQRMLLAMDVWRSLSVKDRLRFIRDEMYHYDWMDLEDSTNVVDVGSAGFDGYLDFEYGSNSPPSGIAVFDPSNVKSVLNEGNWSRSEDAPITNPLGRARVRVGGRNR
jgi:hypothetical protein